MENLENEANRCASFARSDEAYAAHDEMKELLEAAELELIEAEDEIYEREQAVKAAEKAAKFAVVHSDEATSKALRAIKAKNQVEYDSALELVIQAHIDA